MPCAAVGWQGSVGEGAGRRSERRSAGPSAWEGVGAVAMVGGAMVVGGAPGGGQSRNEEAGGSATLQASVTS